MNTATKAGAHTPTPWKIEAQETPKRFTLYTGPRYSNEQCFVGQIYSEQDAALIVRAVNSHAALVEALTACEEHILRHWKMGVGIGNGTRDLLENVKAVLAAAQGGV